MATTPRVSIGLPVYNGAPYLRLALESLVSQTFEDFEVILSDNASTDDTPEVCAEFVARDSRLRYVRQDTNLGAAGNYNFVAREARGEFFKWAAADDECAPRFLEDCVAALDEGGAETVLAWPVTRWIDENGDKLRDEGLDLPWTQGPAHERLRCLLRHPVQSHLFKCSPICGLMRRDVLLQTSMIRPYGGSDRVNLVELALRGRWSLVPAPHFRRREHDQSSLAANKSPEAIARWFDPTRGDRFPMPRVTLFKGYVGAVRRAPLPVGERMRCLRAVGGLFRQEWRVLGGEYKISLKQMLALR